MHYLRFSERAWRLWNNDLLYQNRLRTIDLIDAVRRAGLRVEIDAHKPRPEFVARFSKLEIAPEFRNHPVDQLCPTSVDFAARA